MDRLDGLRPTPGFLPRLRALACLVVALVTASPSAAQVAVEADPADVGSVDAIITALYASISGPMNEARDRNRFLSLFTADARLIPTSADAPGGYLVMTPAQYWANAEGALVSMGFTEAEIGRTTENLGMVTHVFSTYESFREDQGDRDTPFDGGINSIQILEHAGRYWIMTVMWDSTPGKSIPGRYIGNR